MPYLRTIGNIVSSLQLYGFGDAIHAAKVLQEKDPAHIYRIGCRFLGYEGPDMCVRKYERYFNSPGKYLESLPGDRMKELCCDRPLMSQDEAMKELKDAKGTPDYRNFIYYR
jgi:hypothetical protein